MKRLRSPFITGLLLTNRKSALLKTLERTFQSESNWEERSIIIDKDKTITQFTLLLLKGKIQDLISCTNYFFAFFAVHLHHNQPLTSGHTKKKWPHETEACYFFTFPFYVCVAECGSALCCASVDTMNLIFLWHAKTRTISPVSYIQL